MNEYLALNGHCLFIFLFLFELSTANLRRQTHISIPWSSIILHGVQQVGQSRFKTTRGL